MRKSIIVSLATVVTAACSSGTGNSPVTSDGGSGSASSGTAGGSGSGSGMSGASGSGSTGGGGTDGGGQQEAGSTSSGGGSSSSGSGSSGTSDASTASGWGNCPPSWTTTATCGGVPSGKTPNFGPNVLIFDPTMQMATIQSQISTVFTQQQSAEFGTSRYAYFFKPGAYTNLDVQIGFYMQAVGLGQTPDAVTISGAVRAKATWNGGNATTNFWRGVENLEVTPAGGIDGGTIVWAVSQGAHLRRLHVKGNVHFSDGGNSSGGFLADSLVEGVITPGSQQQWFTRNSDMTGWVGANWNIVFVGTGTGQLQPAGSWPSPAITVVPTTPVVREKPFLYIDSSGNYFVMVPGLKTNSTGHSWGNAAAPGAPLSIDLFYIAQPTDTAATINAALASGKHLLLTPGIYHLEAPIQVNNAGTVVMGIGFPSLLPTAGTAAITVADVDGVTLAGFLLDAGPTSTPALMQIGPMGSSADHTNLPTAVFDVHCRVGGATPGTAQSCLTINSHNVLTDNTWWWRADHGAGVGWNTNKSSSGLVVNGDNVTAYGLFVEHHQQYQTLWNGNGGSTYFYQSELPYDPPNQAAWQDPAGHNGYASYKVADTVMTHSAQGLGVYAVFRTVGVLEDNAIETPAAAGVSMHHLVTVSIRGTITHIINGTGATAQLGSVYGYSVN
jgi:hypothetical protein